MTRAELETAITLFLGHTSEELLQAHWELYPERVDEDIPLSLTLLYPWIPAEQVTDADLAELREFFAGRPPLEFDLAHVAEFAGIVVYAVPEPDGELINSGQRADAPPAVIADQHDEQRQAGDQHGPDDAPGQRLRERAQHGDGDESGHRGLAQRGDPPLGATLRCLRPGHRYDG